MQMVTARELTAVSVCFSLGHILSRSRDRDTRQSEPGWFLVPFGLQPTRRFSTAEHHHSRHRHR